MNVGDLKSGTRLYRKPSNDGAAPDNHWYQVVIWRDQTVELLPQYSRGQKGQQAITTKISLEKALTEYQLEKPWETQPETQITEAVDTKKKVTLDRPVKQPEPVAPKEGTAPKNEDGK